jgi:hypothetical protein
VTHVGISDVRIEIARRLREASGGRADGLGEALQLVDAFLRSEDAGKPVEPRPLAEIVTAVESIAEGT